MLHKTRIFYSFKLRSGTFKFNIIISSKRKYKYHKMLQRDKELRAQKKAAFSIHPKRYDKMDNIFWLNTFYFENGYCL